MSLTIRERQQLDDYTAALHRDLDSDQDDAHPTPEGFVGIVVSALIMGCIFAFVMWLEPFTAWVGRLVGL